MHPATKIFALLFQVVSRGLRRAVRWNSAKLIFWSLAFLFCFIVGRARLCYEFSDGGWGRRAVYCHGWPFAYLTRESFDTNCIALLSGEPRIDIGLLASDVLLFAGIFMLLHAIANRLNAVSFQRLSIRGLLVIIALAACIMSAARSWRTQNLEMVSLANSLQRQQQGFDATLSPNIPTWLEELLNGREPDWMLSLRDVSCTLPMNKADARLIQRALQLRPDEVWVNITDDSLDGIVDQGFPELTQCERITCRVSYSMNELRPLLAAFPRLKWLEVYNNSIRQVDGVRLFPLPSRASIEILYLYNLSLSDRDCEWIAQCNRLSVLGVRQERGLTQPLAKTQVKKLLSARGLTQLVLQGVAIDFTGANEDIAHHRRLESVTIMDSTLSREVVCSLINLPRLELLSLAGSTVEVADILPIVNNRNLRYLNLRRTNTRYEMCKWIERQMPWCNVVY
jgi:hypothetical protein